MEEECGEVEEEVCTQETRVVCNTVEKQVNTNSILCSIV